MRTRIFKTLLCVSAIAIFALLAHARTVVRKPTVAELSTAWVGWADSSHYFRLQLKEDGTGLCGFYQRIISSSRLYEITKWTLNGYDIEIVLKPIDLDAWPVTMKGTATPSSLHIQFGDGRKNGWRAKGTLEQERFIESAMESAKKRMLDQKSGEKR